MDSQAILNRDLIRTGYPRRGHVYALTDWRRAPAVATWLDGQGVRAVMAKITPRGGVVFIDVDESPDNDIFRRGMAYLHYCGEMDLVHWLPMVNGGKHCETVGLALRYVGVRGGYVFGF